mmetsp:Transcript_103968/g.252410  ORF Transcript_103968/g.252410 Transcript_103968/m.252410 type:complete len:1043 (+) Transcript_103968:70-3198(+)
MEISAGDLSPFAKFRRVFSGFISETGRAPKLPPEARSTRSFSGEGSASGSVVEFSSAVYYCDEGDGDVELEVVRLGDASRACQVEYMTRDSSAVAGRKYLRAHGYLQFAPGESSKTLRIGILEDQAFDATLEFEVHLTRAFSTTLGAYLSVCRVLICDNDAFPTNRYANQLLSQRVCDVPQWPLMYEFWKMNMADRKFRMNVYKNMIGDQITNLNYVLTTILFNYLIDHVLRPADGSPPPDNAAEMVYVIVSIGLAPHFILWLLDRWALMRRVKGMVISRLQQNLVRKFLSYDESSRNSVSISDLTMAITRDVPVLAHDGLVTCFTIIKNAGLLLILTVLAVKQMGSVPWIAMSVFICAPISMLIFLALRHHGTSQRRAVAFSRQTDLVGYLQQITDCFRLIADYTQGSNVINAFADKIKSNNNASLDSALWELTNQHFAPLIRTIICGSFVLLSFQNVLNGGPLGEFVTGVAVCTRIGQCYEGLYKEVLRIEQAMAPLHNIVFYMNLPVDTSQRMQNSRRLLEESSGARKLALLTVSTHPTSRWSTGKLPRSLQGSHSSIEENVGAKEPCQGIELVHGASTLTPEICSTQTDGMLRGCGNAQDSMQIIGKDVTFAYPRVMGRGTQVLNRASFSIKQGQLVAVTGPRLGGKATLLHLLAGIAPPSSDTQGFLFVPPHLRVLHVGFEPQLIKNLDLFQNLCFGPSDGADEEPDRVVAICKRLRMSEHTLTLVKADCGHISREDIIQKLYQSDAMGRTTTELELVGSPNSVVHRHMSELAAHQTHLLSHTDRCVLHLARALVMNPDVLVLHKPLSHFDDLQAWLVLEVLRNFVDNRGLESPPETRDQRRPRTCIFSTATTKCTEEADMVLHVSHGSVHQIDNTVLNLLRQRIRDLFAALSSSGTGQVTRGAFLDAFREAPWAGTMLGVSEQHLAAEPEHAEALLMRTFDALDKLGTSTVEYDELVHFIRGCMDMKLPELLEGLEAEARQGEPLPAKPAKTPSLGARWEVPPVPSEASLHRGTPPEESSHDVSLSSTGLPETTRV